jgi:hypothetical protein
VLSVSAACIRWVGRIGIPVIGIRRDEAVPARATSSGKVAKPAQRPAMRAAA